MDKKLNNKITKKKIYKNILKIRDLYKILRIRKLHLIFLIILIVAGFTYFLFPNKNSIDENKWQAVFLENNQVYFGKLFITDDFYVLNNVYYLQTEKKKTGGELSNTASPSADNVKGEEKSDTKLVKLGNELHGPEDKMFIEKSKVLFWENMKETSQIVRSIKSYKQTQ